MVLINRDQCVPPRAIAARARVADIICPSGPTTTTSPIKSAIATSAGVTRVDDVGLGWGSPGHERGMMKDE